MIKFKNLILLILVIVFSEKISACSIFYYIDSKTGKIYFVNNEDYWYDVKAYIQIIPGSKDELGRIWYGWKNFGQGGVNEKGLVLDGEATPLLKAILQTKSWQNVIQLMKPYSIWKKKR